MPRRRAGMAAACLLAALPASRGCTNVRVGGDLGGGPAVIGRTMEIGAEAPISDWKLSTHARDEPMGGAHTKASYVLCNASTSLNWRNRYSFVSIESNDIEEGMIPEGMNEAGFTVSAQTLRTSEFVQWPRWRPGDRPPLCQVMVVPYLLAMCRSVEEAKQAIATVVVSDPLSSLSFLNAIKLHWTMSDANGSHAVLEFTEKTAHWYDDEIGVFTNDPAYPWHVHNLDNYNALSQTLPATKGTQMKTKQWGNIPSDLSFGSNLLGMPGDLSPSARFIRMFFLRQFATSQRSTSWPVVPHSKSAPGPSLDNNTVLVQSLLNTVHIVRDTVAKHRSTDMPEMTHWAVMKVPSRRLFYVRTYSDLHWQLIDTGALRRSSRVSRHLDEDRVAATNITAEL